MSWTTWYRAALHALPASLRHKHGAAMAELFVREVERARERGTLAVARVGLRGIGDVLWRAAYEQVRPTAAAPAIDVGVPMRDPAGVGHTSAALPSARTLVGRLAVAFVVACTGSTLLLLAQFAARTAGGIGTIGT
ncbi:MAG: hypothetical protein MUE41_11440, partial [Gemmatimonadaceae bacterium]|nr:hypothetical protein [Gemmatimonadaceae bacterium]